MRDKRDMYTNEIVGYIPVLDDFVCFSARGNKGSSLYFGPSGIMVSNVRYVFFSIWCAIHVTAAEAGQSKVTVLSLFLIKGVRTVNFI